MHPNDHISISGPNGTPNMTCDTNTNNVLKFMYVSVARWSSGNWVESALDFRQPLEKIVSTARFSDWLFSFQQQLMKIHSFLKWPHNLLIGSDEGSTLQSEPRKYVFDVTSIGQRSSPLPCKISERLDKIAPRLQAQFSLCTTYVATNALTNVTESLEAK